MKNLKNAEKLIKLFFISLLFAVSFSCTCYAQQPQQITMSMQQYQALSSNSEQLAMKLATLEIMFQQLEKPQQQLVIELLEARRLLDKAQSSLITAELSLGNVKNLLMQTEQSLQKLEQEIALERKKNKAVLRRVRLQRALAYSLSVVAVAYAANH